MNIPNIGIEKYQIIYADPPWQYRNYNYNTAKRGQEKEYTTMSLDDICTLDVKSISDDNCILFMWATFPYLKEALEVIKEWGFRYYSLGFVWVKTYAKSGKLFWGMGNMTRSNSEICLIGVKGKPKRISAKVHSVIESPVSKHSRKPDEVRNLIVELMGDLPRIELFSRDKVEGWDCWGNEVESDIELK